MCARGCVTRISAPLGKNWLCRWSLKIELVDYNECEEFPNKSMGNGPPLIEEKSIHLVRCFDRSNFSTRFEDLNLTSSIFGLFVNPRAKAKIEFFFNMQRFYHRQVKLAAAIVEKCFKIISCVSVRSHINRSTSPRPFSDCPSKFPRIALLHPFTRAFLPCPRLLKLCSNFLPLVARKLGQ